MDIFFEKYHGLGNSFIMFEEDSIKTLDKSKLSSEVCNGETGVGADGMIVVGLHPLTMQYYNKDGSIASMCGNGLRCFVSYVRDHNLYNDNSMIVNTLAGDIETEYLGNEVRILLTNPSFECIDTFLHSSINAFDYKIEYEDNCYSATTIFLGTIHTVVIIEDYAEIDVEKLGSYISNHEMYKMHTNVNFVVINSEEEITVVTYEIGVGITPACGTGVCSAAYVLKKKGLLSSDIKVGVKLGDLKVEINGDDIYLTGPAKRVCAGQYNNGV